MFKFLWKPAQPIGDQPLWPCPLRVIKKLSAPHMTIYINIPIAIGSMVLLYMITFTINIPPMLAYIPYMDPMGYIPSAVWLQCLKLPRIGAKNRWSSSHEVSIFSFVVLVLFVAMAAVEPGTWKQKGDGNDGIAKWLWINTYTYHF